MAVNVTFRVNMLGKNTSSGVFIGANWPSNNWSTSTFDALSDGNSDGIWEVTLDLTAGGNYDYKYTIGRNWSSFENLTDKSCGGGGPNLSDRELIVPSTDTVLDIVCFNACADCNSQNVTFRLNMANETVTLNGVHIAGSLNDWSPSATPLSNTSGNIYEVTIGLTPEVSYEYKYLNGNSWGTEELVFGKCQMTSNRYVTVPFKDTVLDIYCFEHCNETCDALTESKIASVGSSTTWGATISDRYSDSYPAQLCDLLGTGYNVENYGASGTTMLTTSNSPYWNTNQFDNLLAYEPDTVLIFLGGNDSRSENWDSAQYVIDYNKFIDTMESLSTSPTIYAMIPATYENGGSVAYQDATISGPQYRAIESIARNRMLNVIDLHTATINHPEYYSSDGFHPNPTGAGAIASKIYNVINSTPGTITQNGD